MLQQQTLGGSTIEDYGTVNNGAADGGR